MEDTGARIVANTPDQFAAQIKAEYTVYKEVVARQKLTLDSPRALPCQPPAPRATFYVLWF